MRSQGRDVGSITVVTTPTCPNCRAMQSRLEAAALANPDVPVVELDAAADPGAAAELGIRGVPTYVVRYGGVEVMRRTGRMGRDELDALFVAASTGTAGTGRISRTDRVLRLGSGTVFAAAGILTSIPAFYLLAAMLIIFGGWDVVSPRRRE
jgi:thiol-disulfide isomerase/thioredoxin